jgi:hypothetical protein
MFSPLQIEMLAQARNQETIAAADHRRMAYQYEVDERPRAQTRSKLAALSALRSKGLAPMLRNSLRPGHRADAHS